MADEGYGLQMLGENISTLTNRRADDAFARQVAESAREAGERRVADIATYVDANELERGSIERLEQLVRHGYKFINLVVRKDGRETVLEADWLARLLRERRTP